MTRKKRQLVSGDEAVPVPKQITKPCDDCPFSRDALPGWLGDSDVAEWLQMVHGEARVECHTMIGPQCAGAAIYRANVCKRPRDPESLILPADRERVFATPAEFRDHHGGMEIENVRQHEIAVLSKPLIHELVEKNSKRRRKSNKGNR